MLVQDLHDPRKIQERPRKTVHFINHHAVHGARLYVCEQPLERGPLHVRAGVAAVVVFLRQSLPAFVALAVDERLGGFTLRVKRIKCLIKTLIGGFARIDRASDSRFTLDVSGEGRYPGRITFKEPVPNLLFRQLPTSHLLGITNR